MATGFGIANTKEGVGTTPEDIQAITAAEYPEAGIINGCTVEGTSTLAWKVNAGAVVAHLAKGRAVRIPVQEQTINTRPTTPGASRTDYIYVQQNQPATDGNNSAVVKIGSAVPQGAVMLSKREIRPGVSATSAIPESGNPVYSRPVGGSLGILHRHYHEDDAVRDQGSFTRGAGTFFVPTDRNIDIRISSTVANGKPGQWESATTADQGVVRYDVYLDDQLIFCREREFNNVFDTRDVARVWTVKPGLHKIHYVVSHIWGFRFWRVRGGTERRYAGDQFTIVDMGVASE